MSTETITFLNFIVHSLVIGAAAWLLVRFILRDAMRRCIFANLAVLMCLYSPFDISLRDVFPPQQSVPVWTPLRETFEADWRVSVAPVSTPVVTTAAQAPAWDVNEVVNGLRWFAWLVTAALLLRLLIQSIRVQRWAWRLRDLTQAETDSLPQDLPFERLRVFEGEGTPCVAGWFFPIIAVPAKAFDELTPRQWRWLLRHESEHLRCHDTVAVLLQNIVHAFLWWNPFIHALIEEYARAREEACDAAAVGENRDQGEYADFLLAWAAKAAPQPGCVMPIARSRPARRLKARLVALMEARGVRKKIGALFVLGCAVFAVIAPFVAASFGIATASAQQAAKADPKDRTMFTRIYRVPDDIFLPPESVVAPGEDPFAKVVSKSKIAPHASARSLLEENGITFPEGASAIYQAATSTFVVRHTRASLDKIEAIIDRLHKRLPQVYFESKLIQAEKHLSQHEAILKPAEAKELLEKLSQQKGIDLMSAPNVTTKMGQTASLEVVREILPAKPWDKLDAIEFKFVGPRIHLTTTPAPDGKASIDAKVYLGVDLDSDQPWLPQNTAKTDWSRVQAFTAASKAVLASGETLVLHLTTAKRPVTVLITAEALNPTGQKAINFESTATLQPSSSGVDVSDKAVSEWAVRVYQLPSRFPKDQPPIDVLKAAGILFPKNADAVLKDDKLTVRNTKPNLELIEAWLDALMQVKKSVNINVKVVEMKGDLVKQMNDWLQPSTEKVDATQTPATTESPPLAVRRQFTVSGIFTQPQLEKVMKSIAHSDAKLEVLKPNPNSPMYRLPAAMGGREMKIEPVIGPDGYTIEMTVQSPPQDENPASGISTSVTIWDGQSLVLGSQPSEGVSRLLFITGSLIEESGQKVK